MALWPKELRCVVLPDQGRSWESGHITRMDSGNQRPSCSLSLPSSLDTMRSIPFLLLLFLGTDLFPNAIASPARSPPEPVLASLSPTSPSRPLNLFEKTFKFYSERHPVTSEAVKVDTSSIENEHKLAQSKAADQKGAADQPAAALNSTLHFENEASKAYEVGNNM